MVRHDAAIARWLHAAVADAEARGLPELKGLLEGLAESTRALRAAELVESADAATNVSPASQGSDERVYRGGPLAPRRSRDVAGRANSDVDHR